MRDDENETYHEWLARTERRARRRHWTPLWFMLAFLALFLVRVAWVWWEEEQEWDPILRSESTLVAATCLDANEGQIYARTICHKRCERTSRPQACKDWVNDWLDRSGEST